MGALHRGHASLVKKAREIAGSEGTVIVSIFVNPTQFDRTEDLDCYPSTWQSDLQICDKSEADIIFAPAADVMYVPNHSISISETSLSSGLCGKTRPGHFDGVCLVVNKLFNITRATHALFGEKDFQQFAIIQRMVRDLNMPIEIIPCETIREASGLAMSSRNLLLTEPHREHAPQVYSALQQARQLVLDGETSAAKVIEATRQRLESLPNQPQIDYLELVDAHSLQPITDLAGTNAVLAIAIFFGEVRLIDHIHLNYYTI